MVYLVASRRRRSLLWSFVKSFVLLCLTIEMFLWECCTPRCSRIGVVSFCPGTGGGFAEILDNFLPFRSCRAVAVIEISMISVSRSSGGARYGRVSAPGGGPLTRHLWRNRSRCCETGKILFITDLRRDATGSRASLSPLAVARSSIMSLQI